MSEPVAINDADFEQNVLKAELPVLVDFWAPWCRPCQMIAPILDELAEEYRQKVSFVRMDVDQNPRTASKYNIMSIPTLIIFKGGEPASHVVGLRPKAELKRSLDATIG